MKITHRFLAPISLALGSLAINAVVGCGTPDPILPAPLALDLERASLRGGELVNGLGACGFCHSIDGRASSPLSGGRVMRDHYGEISGPNITKSTSGLGAWSDGDLRKALRANTRPDGSEISFQLHSGIEWLADSDLNSIVSYLRNLDPLDFNVAARRISFFGRNTSGLLDSRVEVKGYVPTVLPKFKIEYGEYLVDHIARCGTCHTKPGGVISSEQYLAGGREISFDAETKVAPNISMSKLSGIGAWSEGDLTEFLRSGRAPTGREIDRRFCPVEFYAKAPAEQIEAVVAYLRTVPAID
jgi:hypothetical protein